MRLHQLTDKQIHEWRMARLEYGRQKYGDRHLQRYNLVDLMEELLDALNIVEFVNERAGHVPKGGGKINGTTSRSFPKL